MRCGFTLTSRTEIFRKLSFKPLAKFPARAERHLVVAEGREVLGVIHLKDVVKGGIKERFAQLREWESAR